jgi:hypothetical protein
MSVEVKGLSDVKAFMQGFVPKLQNNIMRGAMASAAREVGLQAKAMCPVGQPGGENKRIYGGYAGALRDSIHISSRLDTVNMKVVASLVAGGKSKKTGADVYYAHMIEFTGAIAHRIIAKKGKALFFGTLFAESLEHPGFHNKPFMRPALDARMGAAVVAAGEYVRKRLTKQGIETPDLVIEEV